MQVLFCTDGSKISYDAIDNFSGWFSSYSVNILSVSDMTYLPDSVLFNGNKYVTECKIPQTLLLNILRIISL